MLQMTPSLPFIEALVTAITVSNKTAVTYGHGTRYEYGSRFPKKLWYGYTNINFLKYIEKLF
jgi:hypothetical protein